RREEADRSVVRNRGHRAEGNQIDACVIASEIRNSVMSMPEIGSRDVFIRSCFLPALLRRGGREADGVVGGV
ncbi:MAG TPA: hypothetical protein VFK51_11440, partial [Burkholderiales bacterium]|nr:hypothetical protein [Burkholderiales bacterium]